MKLDDKIKVSIGELIDYIDAIYNECAANFCNKDIIDANCKNAIIDFRKMIVRDLKSDYSWLTNKMISYKGYTAEIKYDPVDEIFYGSILGIPDSISFHSDTMKGAEKRFREVIDENMELVKKHIGEYNTKK